MKQGTRVLFTLALASLLWSANAAAADQGTVYLSPGLIYYQAPKRAEIGIDDAELGGGVIVGFQASERVNIELLLGRAKLDYELPGGSGDDNADLFWVDVLYRTKTEGAWQPFILAGAGRTAIDFDNVRDKEKDTQINAGVGVFRTLTERLSLRGDIRMNYSPDHNDLQPFAFVGLTAFLGDLGGAAGFKDADGDGVADADDKCPNTPPGTTVGPDGCEVDSDGDGVVDSADACPGTPAGVAVDARGCPPDSDGDGVPDYMDACPGTPAGVKVDEKGCPETLQETVTIDLNLEFDFDSAQLRPSHHGEIDEVTAFMKQFPGSVAVLEGHTDSRGSDEYNQALSERRSSSVLEYMVNQGGVARDRLTSKGLGESTPIDTNDTDEGRQHNRRVSAKISNGTN